MNRQLVTQLSLILFLGVLVYGISSIPSKFAAVPSDQLAQVAAANVFGNNTIGASNSQTSRTVCGGPFAAPENGLVTSIKVYGKAAVAGTQMSAAIYSDSGTNPRTQLAVSPSTVEAPTASAWTSIPISYTVTSGTNYYLCVWPYGNFTHNFINAVPGFAIVPGQLTTWPNWNSTYSPNTRAENRKMAIYADVTAGASGEASTQEPQAPIQTPAEPTNSNTPSTSQTPTVTPTPTPTPAPSGTSVWYVEKGATGANNGSSWTDAWNELDQIQWSLIKPGHTLYIGGGNYEKSLVINAGGSQGNPVVIKVSQESGHNGQVKIPAIGFNKPWVTLSGAKSDSVSGDIPVKNIRSIIDNINLHVNNTTGTSISVGGSSMYGIKILWVHGYGAGMGALSTSGLQAHGLRLGGADSEPSVEVGYSWFNQNKTDGINCVGAPSTKYGGIKIHHSIIEQSGDDNLQLCGTTDVAYSYVGGQNPNSYEGHPDTIQTLAPFVRIYNNELVAKNNSWVYFEARPQYDNRWMLYGNVLYTDGVYSPGYGISLGTQYFTGDPTTTTWSEIVLANNTVSGGKGSGYKIAFSPPVTEVKHLNSYVINNIAYNTGLGSTPKNGFAFNIAGMFTKDTMKVFNNVAAGHNLRFNMFGRFYNSGEEMNVGEGVTGNTSLLPVFVDPASHNYNLASSDSVARNKGTPLSAHIPASILDKMPDHDKDLNYNSRGGDGVWDIGAHEMAGGSSAPIVSNGSCGSIVNTCAVGNFVEAADTPTETKWSCTGSNGGSLTSCSLTKSTPVVTTQQPNAQTPQVVTPQAPSQPASSGGGGGGGGGSSPVQTPSVPSNSASNQSSGGGGGSGSNRPPINTNNVNTGQSVSVPKLLTAPRTFGSSHDEIKKLQIFLNNNGYAIATVGPGSKGKETNYFGPATLKALNRFQIARGITSRTLDVPTMNLVNSIAGPVATSSAPVITTNISRSGIFIRALAVGASGEDVKALQVFLNSKGYTIATSGPGSRGQETTYYGPATARAVIQFQEFYRDQILKPSGLVRGTGNVGPATLKVLNQLSAQ